MNQMQCPKCHGTMRTYNRSGVHIEQCETCRGIFLDHGELEALARLENQWAQQPPPVAPAAAPPQPAWGAQPHYGYHGHRKHRGFASLFFSS